MSVDIRIGDCRELLRQMPADSVHCVVTSPPYFGLRDYGTAQWDGGDVECDHIAGSNKPRSSRPLGDFHGGDDKFHETPYRLICGKCGARRIDRQIGLEPTPDAFVAEMVGVFREVRRVLRDDGTLWLNLGDSYATQGGPGWQGKDGQRADRRFTLVRDTVPMRESSRRTVASGLKPKDLIGIPWRVAFALQADGWYLRQDIIWSKPNPMPESVTDRCTKAHEYLFLLSKSPRYWYDAEAISEPAAPESAARYEYGFGGAKSEALVEANKTGIGQRTRPVGKRELRGKSVAQHKQESLGRNLTNSSLGSNENFGVRNRRSVWTVATQPFSEAHFATFPPALIEPCIMAGCPKGGTVLDPFSGAGTTGLVADRLGRNAILLELNPAYADMARRRIQNDAGMFACVRSEVAAQ